MTNCSIDDAVVSTKFFSKVATYIQQDCPRLHLFALADREILTQKIIMKKIKDKSLIFISFLTLAKCRGVSL